MASKDPIERRMIARIAALEQHARHVNDPSAHTAPARAAMMSNYEHEVDPQGVLEPAERQRRAKLALQAHLDRIRLLSHQARRLNAEVRRQAARAQQPEASAVPDGTIEAAAGAA